MSGIQTKHLNTRNKSYYRQLRNHRVLCLTVSQLSPSQLITQLISQLISKLLFVERSESERRADIFVLDPFEAAQAFVSVLKPNMQRLCVFPAGPEDVRSAQRVPQQMSPDQSQRLRQQQLTFEIISRYQSII